MTIRRTLAAALAASAIAAPAASAMPAPPDQTHASGAQARQSQDLRGEHAQDAALHPRKAVVVNAPGATVVSSQSKTTPVAPGQPTWAVNPKPLPPLTAQASAVKSDDGVDWTTIGLGIGISLLVIGGIAALSSRSKGLPRTRVST